MTKKEFIFKFVQISLDLAAEFAKQGNTTLSLSGIPEVMARKIT